MLALARYLPDLSEKQAVRILLAAASVTDDVLAHLALTTGKGKGPVAGPGLGSELELGSGLGQGLGPGL